jgi:hypothetical protein
MQFLISKEDFSKISGMNKLSANETNNSFSNDFRLMKNFFFQFSEKEIWQST